MRFTLWYSDFKCFRRLRVRMNNLLIADLVKVIQIASNFSVLEIKEGYEHNYEWLYEVG
jgi:hypothetical protein